MKLQLPSGRGESGAGSHCCYLCSVIQRRKRRKRRRQVLPERSWEEKVAANLCSLRRNRLPVTAKYSKRPTSRQAGPADNHFLSTVGSLKKPTSAARSTTILSPPSSCPLIPYTHLGLLVMSTTLVQIEAWEEHCNKLERRLGVYESENSNLRQALVDKATPTKLALKERNRSGSGMTAPFLSPQHVAGNGWG